MDQAQQGVVSFLKVRLKPWYVEESGTACENLQVICGPFSVQSLAIANDSYLYVYGTFGNSRQEAIDHKELFKQSLNLWAIGGLCSHFEAFSEE